jgi:hypothetical protein
VILVEAFLGIENVLTEVRDIQKIIARKCYLFCQGNVPFENLRMNEDYFDRINNTS